MSCPHSTRLTVPSPSTPIYKEECTLCFESIDSEQGIDVCLTCFNGSCSSHSKLHFNKTKHSLVLNIKRREKVNIYQKAYSIQ